jgi:hypothetical protein
MVAVRVERLERVFKRRGIVEVEGRTTFKEWTNP